MARTVGADVDLVALGIRVRRARLASGLTQAQLAGQDISHAYVSRIEAGQRRPDPDVLRVLAGKLETTVDYLQAGIETDLAGTARLTLRRAELALADGDPHSALEMLTPLRARAADLGALAGELGWVWARCHAALGQVGTAVEDLETILADSTHPWWLQAAALLCRLYRTVGDLSRSIDVGQRAAHIAEELGLAGCRIAVKLSLELAAAYEERGDTVEAHRLCQAAIRAAEARVTPADRGLAYRQASEVADRTGRVDLAARLAERALALIEEDDAGNAVAQLRRHDAALSLRQVPVDDIGATAAAQVARQALAAQPAEVARCDLVLAQAALVRGDVLAARSAAEEVLTGSDARSSVAVQAHLLLARIAESAADPAATRRHYRMAAEVLAQTEPSRHTGALWFELGRISDAASDTATARDAYRNAARASGSGPGAGSVGMSADMVLLAAVATT